MTERVTGMRRGARETGTGYSAGGGQSAAALLVAVATGAASALGRFQFPLRRWCLLCPE